MLEQQEPGLLDPKQKELAYAYNVVQTVGSGGSPEQCLMANRLEKAGRGGTETVEDTAVPMLP